VGLFWYELEAGLPDSAALVQFQNKIRELNRHGKSILWEVPEKKDQNIEQPFSFGYWIHELLAGLDIGVRYFAERKSAWHSMKKNSGCPQPDCAKQADRPAPDKAILFSYYVLRPTYGESSADREALAYLLTNGYTDSYEYSGETSADMKHPFGNVIFYATQEGAAYLAWAKEPQVFNTTIYSKFQNDYFTLFIKVLYQSFSLLIYAEKIQREILTERDARGGTPVTGTMTGLLEEINLFLAKSMATSVSHIHHQSEFYVYLKRQLRIHEDVKSVTAGLNALDTLQKEENEKRERESDNQISAIMGLFALLGISSALVDCFDFITRFFGGETWSELSSGARCVELLFMAIITVVSVTAAIFALRAIRDAFRGKK
jgi:hypothetical protein